MHDPNEIVANLNVLLCVFDIFFAGVVTPDHVTMEDLEGLRGRFGSGLELSVTFGLGNVKLIKRLSLLNLANLVVNMEVLLVDVDQAEELKHLLLALVELEDMIARWNLEY